MATYEKLSADDRANYEIENPLAAASNASDVQVNDVDVEQKQVEEKTASGSSRYGC
jgi:hypothetical protein